MKYELTILTAEKADKEIKDLLKGKDYELEYGGYKQLAYRVVSNEFAHYYYITLDLSEGEPAKLSNQLYIEDWCLRCLLVRAMEK